VAGTAQWSGRPEGRGAEGAAMRKGLLAVTAILFLGLSAYLSARMQT
jgi:hypothetical protein